MKYYIGADLGTSSLKLLLCDKEGNIYNSVTKGYTVAYPYPSWSEQAPELWWNAFVKGVEELTKIVSSNEIGGIAVAGQMHGLVVLDKRGGFALSVLHFESKAGLFRRYIRGRAWL